jgi:hypothetical protein
VKDAEQFGLPPPDPTPAQTAQILATSRRTLYVKIASGHLDAALIAVAADRGAQHPAPADEQVAFAGTNFSRAAKPLSAAAASDAP